MNNIVIRKSLKDLIVEQDATASALDRLRGLSITGRLAEIEANMMNEDFIFHRMALSGQISLFYSSPNTGKTLFFLKFLLDAVEHKKVRGEDVFYINADDNTRGLYIKGKLLADSKIEMVSPAYEGVSPKEILSILEAMSSDGSVKGKVILLDTLKKFANMMDKNSQSKLYETLRRIVAKGGTVIIAGHANKHLDGEGNLVYEGTSDTKNDVDCVYSINLLTDRADEEQVVEFVNEKDRGNVVQKASFKYSKRQGLAYVEMLNSIREIDKNEADAAQRAREDNRLVSEYKAEVDLVKSILKSGDQNQTTIIETITSDKNLKSETSTRRLQQALKKLTNIVWTASKGDRNATIYSLDSQSAAEYRMAKEGY